MRTERRTLLVADGELGEEIATLGFYAHEQFYVQRLISIVHKIRKRNELGAAEQNSIACLIRGLERLPMVTDGLSVRVMLQNKGGNTGHVYFSLFLCFEELELAVGTIVDSGVGFDHQEFNNLRIGLGWRGHDGVESCWDDWLDDFESLAANDEVGVTIENYDSCIDWDAGESGAAFWTAMPKNRFF